MNKNIFSILMATGILFTACNNNVKRDAGKIRNDNKTEIVSPVKHSDPLLHTHATAGTKKLSCCAGPPSRVRIKADKK